MLRGGASAERPINHLHPADPIASHPPSDHPAKPRNYHRRPHTPGPANCIAPWPIRLMLNEVPGKVNCPPGEMSLFELLFFTQFLFWRKNLGGRVRSKDDDHRQEQNVCQEHQRAQCY